MRVSRAGRPPPKLLARSLFRDMQPGAVFVDISIDQGGSAETSRPTTHHDPICREEEVVHYCVTNMPAIVPHTSTYALTNVTLSYALELANKGVATALGDNPALQRGLNTRCYANLGKLALRRLPRRSLPPNACPRLRPGARIRNM